MKSSPLKRLTALTLLVFFSVAGAIVSQAQTPDPGTAGPYTVTREEYNFGNSVFRPTGFPISVEVRASVHYPTGLSNGPYPLVVFLHGRHATCYRNTSATLRWPCLNNEQPIPSFQGYDYIAQTLASNG